MNIRGIDESRCIACKACVEECRRFTFDEIANRVVFSDPDKSCKDCGHCIAVCPEDAILHEGFGDTPIEIASIPKDQASIPHENLFNVIRTCRSVRHYKPDPVPRDIMEKVIDAMRYAPSGSNARSEKFVVISNQEILQQVSGAVIQAMLQNPGMRAAYEQSIEFYKRRYKSIAYFDAPHLIIAYSQLDLDIEDTNIGICLTYGRFAAESLGLGTCWNGWTQIALKGNKELQKLTGAKGVRFGAITIGYPDVKFYRTAPRSMPKVKWVD
jgi:nitroreductase/NAD-dependent dihydropyrimidine dehydrogenase PreA subunit